MGKQQKLVFVKEAGDVRAEVWVDRASNGKIYPKHVVYRTYMHEGEIRQTFYFRPHEVPVAIMLFQLAWDWSLSNDLESLMNEKWTSNIAARWCNQRAFCQEDINMLFDKSATMFPVGKIVVSIHAALELTTFEIVFGLVNHMDGNWGDVDYSEWQRNNYALSQGGPIRSTFTTRRNKEYVIITEHDRSRTTVLLPSEL